MKMLREKKEKLEPEKKKILKSIKIGNDYLELFDNSSEVFDARLMEVTSKAEMLEDRLILLWSSVSLLLKTQAGQWMARINEWIRLTGSKLPSLGGLAEMLEMMNDVLPQPCLHDYLFCAEVQIKIKSLFWLLQHYEDTVFYGGIIRVHDPKGILQSVFSSIDNGPFSLLKRYQTVDRGSIAEM